MPGSGPDSSAAEKQPVPIRPRRIGAGFRAIIATALALGVFVASNALSMRTWARHAFAHHLPGAVSDDVRARISGLSGSAWMVAFFERSSPLRKPARRLLSDFADIAAANPSLALSVESVDANHDLPRASFLSSRWDLEANGILVSAGGRGIVLSVADLAAPSARDGSPVFDGALPCAEALVSLLASDAGGDFSLMRGHGEAGSADVGVAATPLARVLRSGGHEVSPGPAFGLGLAGLAPGSVAVCDSPRVRFTEAEAAEADAFLSGGGRMLLLAGPGTAASLGEFWTRCGLSPILDGEPDEDPAPHPAEVAAAVGGHPVSDGAAGARLLFSDPLRFGAGPGESAARSGDEPRVSVLAEEPRRGALAVAVEWPGLSASGRPGRLVAVGDGAFATEAALRASPGNGRFLRAAASWLAEP